jgi:hypothetical protein
MYRKSTLKKFLLIDRSLILFQHMFFGSISPVSALCTVAQSDIICRWPLILRVASTGVPAELLRSALSPGRLFQIDQRSGQ